MLSELPICKKSSTAILDPKRVPPPRASAEPSLVNVRTESELPTCKKSSTERL
jgi:hypothetical protein